MKITVLKKKIMKKIKQILKVVIIKNDYNYLNLSSFNIFNNYYNNTVNNSDN